MSKVKELYEKVAANSALQAKFNEIISAAEKDGREATETKLTAFAKAAGYEVTAAEMTAFFKQLSGEQKGQLSESELDMVAGGKGGVLLSIGTLGFMCAAGSLISEIDGSDCGEFIQEYE